MRQKIFLILWLIALCVSSQTIKINDVPDWDKIPVKVIHRMYQDHRGFIWYGTFGGLFRYDGYAIKAYRSDFKTPDVFSSNYITNIREDKDANLWIGTIEGLYVLDTKTDKMRKINLGKDTGKNIFTISVTSDGMIWVSVLGTLYSLNADGDVCTKVSLQNNAGVYFVYMNDKNEYIVSVEWQGLFRLDGKGQLEPYHNNIKYRSVEGIIHDSVHNCYWLNTWENGVVKFLPENPAGMEYVEQPLPQNRNGESTCRTYHMVQSGKTHDLWVTTWNGLSVLGIDSLGILRNKKTDSFLPVETPALYDIIEDHKGNLWVSSFDGKSFVVSLDDRDAEENSFVNENIISSFGSNPSINAICFAKNREIWMSQKRRGFILYRPHAGASPACVIYNNVKGSEGMEPNILFPSYDANSVWGANIWSSVICEFKHDADCVMCVRKIDLAAKGCGEMLVRSIVQMSSHTLVVATDKGLYEYDMKADCLNKVWKIGGDVNCLCLTGDGMLVAATNKRGLYVLQGKNLDDEPKFYPMSKMFSCMAPSVDGNVWIGTEHGELIQVSVHTGERVIWNDVCNMNGDMIVSVLTDEFNHVWVATDHELKELSPSKKVYRVHDIDDKSGGLERLQVGVSDGRTICMAGNGGVMFMEASNNLESMPSSEKPVITSITAGGKPYGLVLPSDASNICIEFSSLDILNASRIRYAFKMDGVNNDWVYLPAGQNKAFYSSLPLGRHRFMVKSTGDNGLWSMGCLEVEIVREPHWWETWWACMLYVCVVMLAVSVSIVYYKRYVNKKTTELLFDSKELISMKHYAELERPVATHSDAAQYIQLDNILLEAARKVVLENLSDNDFDVNIFASKMNMSRSTLNRKIKVLTDKTPLEFIKDIKIEQAGMMLRDKTATVHDVIQSLGYSDYKNFANTFKKKFGMSPSEWQKK